ncbi:MAG: 50S ribosomal protein L11 [Candidatus Aenigmarchaeota archaeon]|nr:50S ribosomal protein L11 [Candidatus Aenigmarchaeota archaeon]
MGKQTIDVLVEGGKASAGPPLGPTLSPLKMNVTEIVTAINERTRDFAGMQVPVKIIIDENKKYEIKIGTPPTSAMIKKAIGAQKLLSFTEDGKRIEPGDISLKEVVKIAKSKPNIAGNTLEKKVMQVLGTCLSSGVTVDGKNAKEMQQEIKAGEIKIE